MTASVFGELARKEFQVEFHSHAAAILTIDFPDAVFTEAFQINPQGEIVGNYQSADGIFHEFLLSRDGFKSIDFPHALSTGGSLFGVGINPLGAIVGQYRDSGGTTHGFLLHDGVFTSIDVSGAIATVATAIEADLPPESANSRT